MNRESRETRADNEEQATAMASFGRYIKSRRESLGLTQEDVADDLGLSQGYVSRLELGMAQSIPARPTLRRLARSLRVEMCDLIAAAGYIDRDPAPAEVELEDDEAIFTSLMRGVNRLGISDNDKRAIQITIDLVRRLSDMQREDEA